MNLLDCTAKTRNDLAFSNTMAPHATRLAIQWLEFMRLTQRNELSAKVCGTHHVLRICQCVIFICGVT
jgi:hypothetical protein